MADTVHARPERLAAFAGAAADASESVARRAAPLGAAVSDYRRATERTYEVDCDSVAAAVRAWATAVGSLGAWVGQVGEAFARLPALGGRHLGPFEQVDGALPVALRLGGAASGGALTLAQLALAGAHPRDLRSVGQVIGTGRATGAWLDAAADTQVAGSIGRYLDWGAAVASGAAESEGRWRAEAHLDTPVRAARSAFDGVLATAGTYGGSAAGVAAGSWLCAPLGPPVQAVCASAGARAGSAAGGAAAELVSDAILGDEPEAPPPMPRDGSAVVEARIASAAGRADAAATDHADFVVERPWLWDDEFADAPTHPHPVDHTEPETVTGPR